MQEGRRHFGEELEALIDADYPRVPLRGPNGETFDDEERPRNVRRYRSTKDGRAERIPMNSS